MPGRFIGVQVAVGIFGRGGSIHVPWMIPTSLPQFGTWNSIPFGRDWWLVPGTIHGPARAPTFWGCIPNRCIGRLCSKPRHGTGRRSLMPRRATTWRALFDDPRQLACRRGTPDSAIDWNRNSDVPCEFDRPGGPGNPPEPTPVPAIPAERVTVPLSVIPEGHGSFRENRSVVLGFPEIGVCPHFLFPLFRTHCSLDIIHNAAFSGVNLVKPPFLG